MKSQKYPHLPKPKISFPTTPSKPPPLLGRGWSYGTGNECRVCWDGDRDWGGREGIFELFLFFFLLLKCVSMCVSFHPATLSLSLSRAVTASPPSSPSHTTITNPVQRSGRKRREEHGGGGGPSISPPPLLPTTSKEHPKPQERRVESWVSRLFGGVFPKELTTLLNVELVEGRGKRAGNDLIY